MEIPKMKIYLAGTPGIRERERERMARNPDKASFVLLGYSTRPICYPIRIQFDRGTT
jgi:hypothetical protein